MEIKIHFIKFSNLHRIFKSRLFFLWSLSHEIFVPYFTFWRNWSRRDLSPRMFSRDSTNSQLLVREVTQDTPLPWRVRTSHTYVPDGPFPSQDPRWGHRGDTWCPLVVSRVLSSKDETRPVLPTGLKVVPEDLTEPFRTISQYSN